MRSQDFPSPPDIRWRGARDCIAGGAVLRQVLRLCGERQRLGIGQALEHLDFAIGELRDVKMQASLERALGHRDILKA